MYPDPLPKTSGPVQGRGKVIVVPLDKVDERIGNSLSSDNQLI